MIVVVVWVVIWRQILMASASNFKGMRGGAGSKVSLEILEITIWSLLGKGIFKGAQNPKGNFLSVISNDLLIFIHIFWTNLYEAIWCTIERQDIGNILGWDELLWAIFQCFQSDQYLWRLSCHMWSSMHLDTSRHPLGNWCFESGFCWLSSWNFLDF